MEKLAEKFPNLTKKIATYMWWIVSKLAKTTFIIDDNENNIMWLIANSTLLRISACEDIAWQTNMKYKKINK